MLNMKTIYLLLVLAFIFLAVPCAAEQRKESFDKDPGWDGHNNRIARRLDPREVRQDFGYSSKTNYAGGELGEIGGSIQTAAEAAYYAKSIPVRAMDNRLSASGKLYIDRGDNNMLFGFFNDKTVNEWRTPNAIVVRIRGHGDFHETHLEFTTAKWRATAAGHGNNERGLTSAVARQWSLEYDPKGNSGNGLITLTIDDTKIEILVEPDLRRDGATFNRFGLLNVIKSADNTGQLWLDDITINGEKGDSSRDPKWNGLRNRKTYETRGVRPWFDFGYSATNYAGGKAKGELGGMFYRGDCRYPERIACYGDKLNTLTLDQPLKASGKVTMRRGVTDSTTCIGFYNSKTSMTVNESQQFSTPRDFIGIYIEGPSREGFFFYPICRNALDEGSANHGPDPPHILPDGSTHSWTFDYDPAAANGAGRMTVTLDGRSTSMDLPPSVKAGGASFDRFGIVTTWIDGNGQEVYFDDLDYTSR